MPKDISLYKKFSCLCTELARHKAMKSVFSVLQHVKSVTNGHFVSCDLLVYYHNWTGMMNKMAVSKS